MPHDFPAAPRAIRLDVWLDVACLFKTRSDAQKACKGGKVDLNGHSAKPNKIVAIGNVIDITRPQGRRQRLIVRGLEDRHIAKADARALYEDVTPPPSPEEQALLDLIQLAGPRRGPAARRDAGSPGAAAAPPGKGGRGLSAILWCLPPGKRAHQRIREWPLDTHRR